MNRKLKLAQDFLAYHTKNNSVKWEVGFLQQSADAPLSFLKRLHWMKKKKWNLDAHEVVWGLARSIAQKYHCLEAGC